LCENSLAGKWFPERGVIIMSNGYTKGIGMVPWDCRMGRRATGLHRRYSEAINGKGKKRAAKAREFKLERLRVAAIRSGDWSAYEAYLKG